MLVLAICCMSLFIVGIDVTIVNVALPSIQRDLHAPVSGLQWTVDAYTIVVASFLMLSGSTGDRIGRRRIFQVGLGLFTLGSLACSLAPGLGWLVAFRMVQALGGSMLNPVAMSIITNTFTDPAERARAIGMWGAVFGISMALGPVIGGALVTSVGWRGIFWVNIPVGVAAIILTALFVPESRAPRARRVDPVGQVLIIVLLASLTYGIIEGPNAGWGSARILGCFALAAAALVGLVAYEPRRDEPLLDLRFFRSAPFSGRDGDRGVRVRRARRVPVPEHPVPAGRARPLGAARRPVHAADGGDDRAARAVRRPHRRGQGTAAAADRGGRCHHGGRDHADPDHPATPRSAISS